MDDRREDGGDGERETAVMEEPGEEAREEGKEPDDIGGDIGGSKANSEEMMDCV